MLTWGIQMFCPGHAALFPALWATLFSLGIFASRRHLPAGGLAIATYYLAAAVVCLRWGQGDQALQPWTMAVSFGIGQLLTSVLLYRHWEVADESL
jgi:hypothetical protein